MNYNNSHFKFIFEKPIIEIIKIFANIVNEKSPIKDQNYARNKKYTLNDYIIGIIDVMRYNHSWNAYSGIVNGNTLRKKHNEWIKLGIYEQIYNRSINKYLKQTPKTEEFKYQSIDSTFIREFNGSKNAAFNKIYKEKKGKSSKGIKITSITTTTKIPISRRAVASNRLA